jgi:hypothetical protein
MVAELQQQLAQKPQQCQQLSTPQQPRGQYPQPLWFHPQPAQCVQYQPPLFPHTPQQPEGQYPQPLWFHPQPAQCVQYQPPLFPHTPQQQQRGNAATIQEVLFFVTRFFMSIFL